MRLFTRKASKSTKSVARTARKQARPALGQVCSSRDSIFEAIEGRQMFNATLLTTINPIIFHPILTNSAISAEYTHTASETDAYGQNVHSLLGTATSPIEFVSGVSGAEVQFYHDNGAIYWSASTGAHVVYGAIGAEYAHLASETDAYGSNVQLLLGLPTTDEQNISGVAGTRQNVFQHGYVDWSASTGAHIVYGGIGGQYMAMGGPTSWLGMPTGDEYGPQNNRISSFQDGYISWSPSGGPVVHETSITFGTRYGGSELVITENGLRDSLNISQSGSTLSIFANGQFSTRAVPSGGVFVYTRGGADQVYVGSSVSAVTTVDAIDNAHTNIWAYGSRTITWDDSGDSYSGIFAAHSVGSFAGGVSKALGWHLANPSDSGSTFTPSGSLFGRGPVAADINQGSVGDCYYLATLAGYANNCPDVITNSAVDLGDGTYAVEYFSGGTPSFVRVNANVPTGGFGGYKYDHPGTNGTLWGVVMEKAFAYFRTSAHTWANIASGWPSEVYSDLHQSSASFNPGLTIFWIPIYPDNTLFSIVSSDLASGKPVTLCTPGSVPNLVADHCYTLVSTYTVGGVHKYVVRNPWGTSGDSLEDSHGYATLTYNQLVANFTTLTEAT